MWVEMGLRDGRGCHARQDLIHSFALQVSVGRQERIPTTVNSESERVNVEVQQWILLQWTDEM